MKLLQLRKSLGLSQENITKKMGVTRQTILNWETGISSPTLTNAVKLAKILGVTVNELIEDEK